MVAFIPEAYHWRTIVQPIIAPMYEQTHGGMQWELPLSNVSMRFYAGHSVGGSLFLPVGSHIAVFAAAILSIDGGPPTHNFITADRSEFLLPMVSTRVNALEAEKRCIALHTVLKRIDCQAFDAETQCTEKTNIYEDSQGASCSSVYRIYSDLCVSRGPRLRTRTAIS